jgi:hypothetical protein
MIIGRVMQEIGTDVSEESITALKMEAACLSESMYLSTTLHNVTYCWTHYKTYTVLFIVTNKV